MATVVFTDSDGDTQSGKNGAITTSTSITTGYSINALTANTLYDSKCVIYMGFGTGITYTKDTISYNLISSTYNKGAHFVLGTTDVVYTNATSNWITNFSYKASRTGATISDCLSYASYYVGDVPLVTKGDKNCVLNY